MIQKYSLWRRIPINRELCCTCTKVGSIVWDKHEQLIARSRVHNKWVLCAASRYLHTPFNVSLPLSWAEAQKKKKKKRYEFQAACPEMRGKTTCHNDFFFFFFGKDTWLFRKWRIAGGQIERRPRWRVRHNGWATPHKACLKSSQSSTGGGKHCLSAWDTMEKRELPPHMDSIIMSE